MRAPQEEPPSLTIAWNARARSAADLMAESGQRALAVVDDSGACIGVIDAEDLLLAWKRGMRAENQRRRVRRFRPARKPVK